MSHPGFGVLKEEPDETLFRLFFEPAVGEGLPRSLSGLLRVDAAHVLALERSGALPLATAALLLAENRRLGAELEAGRDPLPIPPRHRGLYSIYEAHLVARLGVEVGGAGHLGRSRNDLNAALTRLRLRAELLDTLDAGQVFLEALLAQVPRHLDTVMAGFSQLQPAQPSTLAHYLAGVGFALLRDLEWLSATYPEVNRSPLGAAAGFGSSVPLPRERVAEWLGFEGLVESSLDAVASRDYGLRVLSAGALCATTLTRLASDFLGWAGPGCAFLDWPDRLVGTSSMMPQKRNPFVLEVLRGRAGQVSGALAGMLADLKGTPFSNSVEVSSEATAHLWRALPALRGSLELAGLLVAQLRVDARRMEAWMAGRATAATALAEWLSRSQGPSFRAAYSVVAAAVRDLEGDLESIPRLAERLAALLAEKGGERPPLAEAAIRDALEPRAAVARARYGGGPAPEAVERQLAALREGADRLVRDAAERRRRLAAADSQLRAAIDQAVQKGTS